MLKRIFFTIIISLLMSSISYSQFFHIGLKSFMTMSNMTFFEYKNTDYVYYFSNEKNETIRFSGLEETNTITKTPFPALYLRYNNRNHLFIQAEVFGLWFTNEAKYKNSVDYSQYISSFNPDNDEDNLGYNTIKMNWSFVGTSFSIGYLFFKTKALRPFIFIGGSTLHLMKLEQGKFYDDTRQLRNNIIFSNLSTFKKTTYYLHSGLGFQYKAFSIDAYYRNSVGDTDIYANNYIEAEDISLTNRPNYDFFNSFNISISLNLLSFNLSKNRNKDLN